MKYIDCNNKVIKNGDILTLHQTINGEEFFIMVDVDSFDMRYGRDISIRYQYDVGEFLRSNTNGELDVMIVGNIHDHIIHTHRSGEPFPVKHMEEHKVTHYRGYFFTGKNNEEIEEKKKRIDNGYKVEGSIPSEVFFKTTKHPGENMF